MSVTFNTVEVSGDLVPATLPLVQVTWPAVDLTGWRNFVQFFTDQTASRGSGVSGLRDASGCYCGVFAHQLDRDLLVGPILAVHLFTAVDVVNAPRTIDALLDAAETRALELACEAVRIRLCNDQAKLAFRLRVLGLSSEIGQFWKKVNSP